ncbi:MAG: sigma-70 family RNA polymerase sigma factor [Deltaproteobacteria bacterium]|nr:sigma-70 family RNA polymerase sigma factor [Deltaproteobacteria bacterium]
MLVPAPGCGEGESPYSIVDGLHRGDPNAASALFDRAGERVNRLVWRMLGADPEHDDLVHQVFVDALANVHKLRDPESLDRWIVSITLNIVRKELRTRRLRRLLRLDVEDADAPSPELDPERHMLARRFYSLLEQLSADEQIAFTLRLLEGCALAEVAAACECSLATAKRRLSRALASFTRLAQVDPVLSCWIASRRHEG